MVPWGGQICPPPESQMGEGKDFFFLTEGKMNSVTQSIHSKCQCVIDCASLAPRCCSPSDQYHHYPNYAASYSSVPCRWSLFRRGNAGTGERMERGSSGGGNLLDTAATARTLERALVRPLLHMLLLCFTALQPVRSLGTFSTVLYGPIM